MNSCGRNRSGSYFRCIIALVLVLNLQPATYAQGGGGGGQTKANESAFTTDTLKAYLDAGAAKDAQILALHKELSELRDHHAQELREAADKRYEQRFQAQESATTKASANQNEFRASLNDLSSTKVSIPEFKLAFDAIKQQIFDAAKTTDAKLADIQHRLDIREGSSQGIGSAFGNTATAIGAIVAVLGVIYLLSSRKNTKPPWMDELITAIKTSRPAT